MFEEINHHVFFRVFILISFRFLSSAANSRFRQALQQDGTRRQTAVSGEQTNGTRVCLFYPMIVRSFRIITGLHPTRSQIVAGRSSLSFRRNPIQSRFRFHSGQARFLVDQDRAAQPDQYMFNCHPVMEDPFTFNVSRDRPCT